MIEHGENLAWGLIYCTADRTRSPQQHVIIIGDVGKIGHRHKLQVGAAGKK